jgi:hypothetical protein
MRQLRKNAALLHEPSHPVFPIDAAQEQLERHLLLEVAIVPLRQPDLTHAATPQQAVELKWPDALARRTCDRRSRFRDPIDQGRRDLAKAAIDDAVRRRVRAQQAGQFLGQRRVFVV